MGWRALLETGRSVLTLRKLASHGADCTVLGRVWVHGGGEIHLGNRVTLDARRAPIELHALAGGTIYLGDDVVVEGGASLEAQSRIQVGARSRLGAFCKVIDTQFHPLRGDRTQRPEPQPVVLEEEVMLAERAMVLPGVVLGRGAQLRAGTLVSRRVPPGTVMAGNPARVVTDN